MTRSNERSTDFDTALVDLLLEVFPGDRVRIFVATLSVGTEIAVRLPGPVASALEVAHKTVRLLQEFDGVEEALDAIERARPNRRASVTAVREIPRFRGREI